MDDGERPTAGDGTGVAPGVAPEGLEGLGLAFHHVGVACRDLDREAAPLLALGFRAEGDDFTDPVQGVRGRFLVGPGPRLELLAPLPGRPTLDPWLGSKVKFYHLAYETRDLDAAVAAVLDRCRAKPVVAPVASVAFAPRRIAFVMLPTLALVELIGP